MDVCQNNRDWKICRILWTRTHLHISLSPSGGLTWSENQTLECPERSSPSSTRNINSDQEKVSRRSPDATAVDSELVSHLPMNFAGDGLHPLQVWGVAAQSQGVALYYEIKTGFDIIVDASGSATKVHGAELHPWWRHNPCRNRIGCPVHRLPLQVFWKTCLTEDARSTSNRKICSYF